MKSFRSSGKPGDVLSFCEIFDAAVASHHLARLCSFHGHPSSGVLGLPMSRTVGRKLSTVIDPRQSPTRPESSESIASTCSDETSQINDTNEEMSSPSPSYTNYAICSKDNLIQYSEDELQTIYNEAITKFNLKPKSLRDYLASKRVIQGLPSEIAAFLHEQTKLSKRRVGEYIGQQDNFNQKVCEELFARYNFAGMTLDNALRVLTRQFRLPGEAQQIDRILEKFANAYHMQNNGVFLSADTAYILAFSIIMLNTDLHNQSITPEKKMKLEEFIRNNRGINQGKDVDKKLLEELYYSIKNNEIRMDDTDMYESEVIAFMAPTKSGWLEKKAESMLPIWKRHWFVLNDGCLYYFIAPSDEGPRCIIPLDNTRIGRGYGQLEFIIASATGDYVKSSKLLEDGRMEQGKHTQFVLRATSAEDREAWVAILQQESMRFKPLHEIFLRRSEQEPNVAEKPLELPSPIAEGWMRKRGGLNPAWKRRYFVLYPDFDGGGNTLFYYVSHQVAIRMRDLGIQTQQGYIRMRNIRELIVPKSDSLPLLQVVTDDRTWTFTPDDPDKLDYWFEAIRYALSPYIL